MPAAEDRVGQQKTYYGVTGGVKGKPAFEKRKASDCEVYFLISVREQIVGIRFKEL